MKLCGDLHIHTHLSPDSRTTLEEAVRAAKTAGLDFIALTDHDLPPEEEVFARPEREGLLLVPGVEYTTDQGHLLGLFLEKPCPPSPGERLPLAQAAERIHRCGGLAVLAHPFQSTAQTPQERLAALEALAPLIDGLEVCNRRATKKRRNANLLAEEAAEKLFPQGVRTAGSDAHLPQEIGAGRLTVDCGERSLPALRAALTARSPCAWEAAPCCNRLIAESQKIKLEKAGAPLSAWARWLAFRGLCQLRDWRTGPRQDPQSP